MDNGNRRRPSFTHERLDVTMSSNDKSYTSPMSANIGVHESSSVVILPAISGEFDEPLSATMTAYREKAAERQSSHGDPYGRSADA